MQYLLKVTILGVKHHVFRVVSVDGAADIEHVLNLCDLSFDYAGYNTKELYFAKDYDSFTKMALDYQPYDEKRYGPSGKEFDSFWHQQVELSKLNTFALKLCDNKSDFIKPFDELIESQSALYQEHIAPRITDLQKHFKFIYVLNGVQHLVEVMTSSEKLKCFLPAALMGEGLIEDSDETKPLSLTMLNEFLSAHENDENFDDGLNLKDCTARLRALGSQRNSDNINNAIVKAGAKPLNFVAD